MDILTNSAMHRNHPKHSNLENRCFRYIRTQKSPKKAQKTNHSIAICSILLIGMVYKRLCLVNPHVQTFRNMYGQGWYGVFEAVANQYHSPNFGPIALKRIEYGLRYWDSRFYSFKSDRTKMGGVTLICNSSDFS